MTETSLRVFAPATVANVACGFDVLGFALDNPGDEIVATLNNSGEVTITTITGDEGVLPKEAAKNAASAGVKKMLQELGSSSGVSLEIHKKMPLGSGLGSSAASAAGGVFAVNALLDYPLTTKELIPYAMEGERVACGSAHADNVAPALVGGFVAIRSYDPLDVIEVPTDLMLTCLIVKPRIEVMTKQARQLLGKSVSFKQLVTQTGNLSGLLVALMRGDEELLKRSLIDVIAEPLRAKLIPHYEVIKETLINEGALGCSLSGSGPSLFSLYSTFKEAEKACEAVKKLNLEADYYFSPINRRGVMIIEGE